jgi:hypothetical protein
MDTLRGYGWAVAAVLIACAFWGGMRFERHQEATRQALQQRMWAQYFWLDVSGVETRFLLETDRQLTAAEASYERQRLMAYADSGIVNEMPWVATLEVE